MEPAVTYYRPASRELPIHVNYRVYSGRDLQGMGFTYVATFFSILLVYRGQVQTSISGKPVVLAAGDMRIFLKNDLHHLQYIKEDTRYVQISLSPEALALPKDNFLNQYFVQPLQDEKLDCPRLLRPGDPGYDAIYSHMHRLDCRREGQECYPADLFAIAVSLCAALLPYCTTNRESSYGTEDAVRTCLTYMTDHSGEKITLEQLAQLVHLHPNYLCAVFKKFTGKTIFDHLTRQRLRRATKRLRYTQLTVQQIAERTGFPSVSFFSRKFRSVYGCSPAQYRKQYGNHYPEIENEEQIPV